MWVKSDGAARVYGSGRMAAYTNLSGGLQAFYFAQIERVHAGKTMIIELFDPGEVSGNGFLRIQTPERQRLQLRDLQLALRRRAVGDQRHDRSRRPSTAPPSSTTGS